MAAPGSVEELLSEVIAHNKPYNTLNKPNTIVFQSPNDGNQSRWDDGN